MDTEKIIEVMVDPIFDSLGKDVSCRTIAENILTAIQSSGYMVIEGGRLTGAEILSLENLRIYQEAAANAVRNAVMEECAQALGKWQPIETAPKDGSWFLLRGRNSAGMPMIPVVCGWQQGVTSLEKTWRDSANLRDVSSIILDVPPGHSAEWMPLPSQPQAQGEIEERSDTDSAEQPGSGLTQKSGLGDSE